MKILSIIGLLLTILLTVLTVLFLFKRAKLDNAREDREDEPLSILPKNRIEANEYDSYLVNKYMRSEDRITARDVPNDRTASFRRGTYGR